MSSFGVICEIKLEGKKLTISGNYFHGLEFQQKGIIPTYNFIGYQKQLNITGTTVTIQISQKHYLGKPDLYGFSKQCKIRQIQSGN